MFTYIVHNHICGWRIICLYMFEISRSLTVPDFSLDSYISLHFSHTNIFSAHSPTCHMFLCLHIQISSKFFRIYISCSCSHNSHLFRTNCRFPMLNSFSFHSNFVYFLPVALENNARHAKSIHIFEKTACELVFGVKNKYCFVLFWIIFCVFALFDLFWVQIYSFDYNTQKYENRPLAYQHDGSCWCFLQTRLRYDPLSRLVDIAGSRANVGQIVA